MSTFVERPYDFNSDGKSLTNRNEQSVSGQKLLEELREGFLQSFKTDEAKDDLQSKGFLKVEICKDDDVLERGRLDKLSKNLQSVDSLSENSTAGNMLEKLFSKTSEFGEHAMDRLVDQFNKRLEDSGRMLKVKPEDGRMPPSAYTITLFDLKANRNLGSVEAQGLGRK